MLGVLFLMNGRKIIFIGLLVLFCNLLTGCQYLIEITLTDKTALTPIFELKEQQPFFFDRAVNLREITVYKRIGNKLDYSNPVWMISSDGIKIKKVIYGVTPEGFSVQTPARKLEPYTQYHISARGWGSTGFLDFELEPGGT